MSWQLTRPQVKSIFLDSLRSVADFQDTDPNLENYEFALFQNEFYKKVFLTELLRILNKSEYQDPNGVKFRRDIDISLNDLSIWKFKDCIDYVKENQQIKIFKKTSIPSLKQGKKKFL